MLQHFGQLNNVVSRTIILSQNVGLPPRGQDNEWDKEQRSNKLNALWESHITLQYQQMILDDSVLKSVSCSLHRHSAVGIWWYDDDASVIVWTVSATNVLVLLYQFVTVIKYNLSPSRAVLNSAGPRHPHRRRLDTGLHLFYVNSEGLRHEATARMEKKRLCQWKINVVMETPGSEPVLLQLLGLHCFSWNRLNWLVNYIFLRIRRICNMTFVPENCP